MISDLYFDPCIICETDYLWISASMMFRNKILSPISTTLNFLPLENIFISPFFLSSYFSCNFC